MSFCRNHSMTFYCKGIKRLHIYILYIYIYILQKLKPRKQLISNLTFHADTAASFSQMNKTLKFTIP